MPVKPDKNEYEVAVDKILIELPKQDRRLAERLTKEMHDPKYASFSLQKKKLAKVQLLAKSNRQLLETIVKTLLLEYGPAGKSNEFPKSMIAFLERMPELKTDDSSHFKEMTGGNYRNL